MLKMYMHNLFLVNFSAHQTKYIKYRIAFKVKVKHWKCAHYCSEREARAAIMQAFSMRDFNFKSNSIAIFIYIYENLTHFPVQNLLELDFWRKDSRKNSRKNRRKDSRKNSRKNSTKNSRKTNGNLWEKFQDILLENSL